MLKGKLQEILLIIGAIIQILGFIVYFRDTISNPFYLLALMLVGYGLIVYYCLNRLLKKQTKTSSIIMDASGASSPIKTPHYSKRTRVSAATILAIATVAALSFGFSITNRSGNPVAPPPELSRGSIDLDLVRINKVNWTGGGAFAEVKGHEDYPLSYIEDTSHLENMSRLTGTACALKFEVEPRSDLDRVTIDDIKVVVSNYKPLPRYAPMLPAPFQEENILYLEVDNPAPRKEKAFPALKRVNKGKIEDIGVMYLAKGSPETFVIRINAKRPGIYTIECQMTTRYKDQTSVVTLNTPRSWLFDKRTGK